jgi:hypothetical protein
MNERTVRWWLVGWLALGTMAGVAIWVAQCGQPLTEWWMAWLVGSAPLLINLRKKLVAGSSSRRKMHSVEWDLLRRMGLVLALALVVFFLPGSTLTQHFWVALAVWYQVALALDVCLQMARWQNDTTAGVDSPGAPSANR